MKIESIYYSESIEAVNNSGNKRWFKSAITISDVKEEATKATELAKRYVTETLQNSLSENYEYSVNPKSYLQVGEIIHNQYDVIKEEFDSLKEKLLQIQDKEQAKNILDSSGWKYNLELNNIINSKK